MKLYEPPKDSHKGDNGRLLIIGGSRQYHGAAMLSILAARRFVDLVYFYPGEKDPYLMKAVKTIPEVIMLNGMTDIEKMDCLLFGVGLGKAKARIPKPKTGNLKLVIDGDGLKSMKGDIPEGAILTPHEGEFQMLFGMKGSKENVKKMAKKYRCIILKKGSVDIISDGLKVKTNSVHNPGMTKGGTGDVLAGLVAALACKNDSFDAAVAGAQINGMAGEMLKKEYGFSFCAGDLVDKLPLAYKKLDRR